MLWDTACPDWEQRILAGRSLIPTLPLFDEEADKALRIFKRLRCPDIEGHPTYGEVCDERTFDLVRAIFGSYDAKLKKRMIREFFLLIPKKNGKSSLCAAIIVTAAIMNRRPAAELLLIAPTKKIAEIAYVHAAGIIRLDAELSKLFHPQLHIRTITHRLTHAVIVIKAADADVITGSKATYILVDETHVFALKARAAHVFAEIRGGLAARPDGFLIQITTQSKDPPAGVFKNELMVAREVRDGKLKLPLLAVLYELPERLTENGGWKDPRLWGLVNPNLNRSVSEDWLRDALIKAESEGAESLALLASQHFNVEIGLALSGGRWRGADHWEAAADTSITLQSLMERCDVITAGIDGGGLDDLFGLGLIGRCRTTRDWLSWNHAWVQRDVLDLRKDISQNLLDFAADGDLTICDDATTDINEAADIVEMIRDAGLLPEKLGVGLDPFGVAGMIDALAERKIGGDTLSAIRQGSALSPAVWGLERKLKDGTFWHAGQPLMAWCIGNAKAEQRGNATLITKQTAGRAKIDPLVATFNAAMLMSRNPVVLRAEPMAMIA
jgi:phage terminase large subunit-like protein